MVIKRILICSILFFCLLVLSTSGRAEELTLVFTGQTHAMLYPCTCPKDPEGGVARRATAIKQVRSAHRNVVVVEAGSSFGSGPDDQHAQNFEKDMQRTQVYLKSLRAMGYDALLLSSQEYVFGSDFLKSREDIPFVSTNTSGVGVPAVVKKVGALKVGIIGITNQAASDRGAADWKSPNLILGEKIAALKKEGADVIILLSSLKPQEDLEVLKGIKGVDVVVNGSSSLGAAKDSVVDGAVHLTTWWQTRRLGVMTFDVSRAGVTVLKRESVPLRADIPDDKEIAALVPACFRNEDCRAGGAEMNGRCEAPGTSAARCAYLERPKVGLTVIQPRRCHTCRSEEILKIVREVFGPLNETFLFEDDPAAREMISKFKITMAPAYILDKSAEKAAGFPSFAIFCDKAGDDYVIKPSVAGVSFALDKKRIPRRLDVVWGVAGMPTGLAGVVKEFRDRHPETGLRLHLMAERASDGVWSAKGGEAALEETRRAACVGEISDAALLSYLVCRQASPDADAAACLQALPQEDRTRVGECLGTKAALEALEKRSRFVADFPIVAAPAFVVENVEIFGVVNTPSYSEFEKTVMGVSGASSASPSAEDGHDKINTGFPKDGREVKR